MSNRRRKGRRGTEAQTEREVYRGVLPEVYNSRVVTMLEDSMREEKESRALVAEFRELSPEAGEEFQRTRPDDFERVVLASIIEGVVPCTTEGGIVRTWTRHADPYNAAAEYVDQLRAIVVVCDVCNDSNRPCAACTGVGILTASGELPSNEQIDAYRKRDKAHGTLVPNDQLPEHLQRIARTTPTNLDAAIAAVDVLDRHNWEFVDGVWRVKPGWVVSVQETAEWEAIRELVDKARHGDVIEGVFAETDDTDAILSAAAAMFGGVLTSGRHGSDHDKVADACVDRVFAMREKIRARLGEESKS